MTAQISQLGLLIFVSAVVAMLSRKVHLPYTVGLVLAGIGLNVLPSHLDLQLSKELILPPLVARYGGFHISRCSGIGKVAWRGRLRGHIAACIRLRFAKSQFTSSSR